MPAYDYDCAACGRRFEVIHGVHAERPTTCPLCGKGPVRKAISAPAVHYRGSGWAKKERRTTPTAGSKATADGPSTADGSPKPDKASGDGPAEPSASPAPKAAETGAASKTD